MADQLKFCFEPVGHEQWDNLREYMNDDLIPQYCKDSGIQRKYLAADLGLSPSRLKRKLAGYENDTSNFTTDDLEAWLLITRDLRPLYYLLDKYGTRDDELARLKARVAELETLGGQ